MCGRCISFSVIISLLQSPAPPSSTSSSGLPYHSPEYRSPQPGTPNTSQASAAAGSSSSSSSSSRLKPQDTSSSLPSASTASSSSSQKNVDLSSPKNSELPKAPSISCLREALMATTSITPSGQPYPLYSSPRMRGGAVGGDQPSPLTPSSHHPVPQDSTSLLSPQSRKNAPVRQDSQLSSSSAHSVPDQEHQLPPYPMQNSLTHHHHHHHQQQLLGQASLPPSGHSDSSAGQQASRGHHASNNLNSIPREESGQIGNKKLGKDTDVLSGVKSDMADTSPQLPEGSGGGQQSSSTSSSPLANPASRGGGGTIAADGGDSALDSPCVVGSPRSSATLNSASSGSAGSNRQNPAPARPDLLGFPVRSSSLRGENQPSPLTEDTKNVSCCFFCVCVCVRCRFF